MKQFALLGWHGAGAPSNVAAVAATSLLVGVWWCTYFATADERSKHRLIAASSSAFTATHDDNVQHQHGGGGDPLVVGAALQRRWSRINNIAAACCDRAKTSSPKAAAVAASLFPSDAATIITTAQRSSSPLRPPFLLAQSSTSTLASKRSCNMNSKLIFLGTGSSTGCPRPLCSLLFSNPPKSDDNDDGENSAALRKMRKDLSPFCRTSNLASDGDPLHNKNYRNNPSFLISTVVNDTASGEAVRKNVIIDVGKTFREGALRWLPATGIRSLDAIVLTHQHMDAAAGLDDVRGFQKYEHSSIGGPPKQLPMPLFLSSECLACLQDQFPWLLPKRKPTTELSSSSMDGAAPTISRHVASFDVTVFEAFKPFDAIPGSDALTITPLPVVHGEDLISYGFAFTVGGVSDNENTVAAMNVVYLSDISRMLPETLEHIQTKLPQPTHVLVLDALHVEQENPVHYNLPQAMALVQQIRPLQTYFVGMNCDSFAPHDEMNERLRKEYGSIGSVQLAHDGLVITVNNEATTTKE